MRAARNTLSAGEEVLLSLTEKCSVKDEWEERQKSRQTKIQAAGRLHSAEEEFLLVMTCSC